MKKLLLLSFTTFSLFTAKAQNVIYLFGMDGSGRPVINTAAIPNVVNTGGWADVLSKPSLVTSLTTTGTSGAATFNTGTGVLNIPNYTPSAYTGGTGISVAGSVITNTAPDQTVAISSGAGIGVTGTYPNFTVTNSAPDQTVSLTGANGITTSGTYPNFTITLADPVFNTGVIRSLNTNYTISSTKKARVYYTIRIAYNITVLLGSTGSVDLQYSTNGGSTWITLSTVSNSLNLGLALTGYNDFPISGEIPANALVRLNSTVTNATNTYQKGEEVTY